MFLSQCGGAEVSVMPSQSLQDVVVELKQYAAGAGKIVSSVRTTRSKQVLVVIKLEELLLRFLRGTLIDKPIFWCGKPPYKIMNLY